jgi:hypothetical protein
MRAPTSVPQSRRHAGHNVVEANDLARILLLLSNLRELE